MNQQQKQVTTTNSQEAVRQLEVSLGKVVSYFRKPLNVRAINLPQTIVLIHDVRRQLLVNYDVLPPESRAIYSDKINLVEKLYADERERVRLSDIDTWKKIATDNYHKRRKECKLR